MEFKTSIVEYDDVQAKNRQFQIGATSEAENLLLEVQRFLELPAFVADLI